MITRQILQKRPNNQGDEGPKAKHHKAFISMMNQLDCHGQESEGISESRLLFTEGYGQAKTGCINRIG